MPNKVIKVVYLPLRLLEAIDTAVARYRQGPATPERPRSRNAWITAACIEKLERDGTPVQL